MDNRARLSFPVKWCEESADEAVGLDRRLILFSYGARSGSQILLILFSIGARSGSHIFGHFSKTEGQLDNVASS